MRCNTPLMNSWHSFSPNGRWMVFSSKSRSPYTQMFLTHLDENGNDTPPILIENSTAANRAVNIPEFVNIAARRAAEDRRAGRRVLPPLQHRLGAVGEGPLRRGDPRVAEGARAQRRGRPRAQQLRGGPRLDGPAGRGGPALRAGDRAQPGVRRGAQQLRHRAHGDGPARRGDPALRAGDRAQPRERRGAGATSGWRSRRPAGSTRRSCTSSRRSTSTPSTSARGPTSGALLQKGDPGRRRRTSRRRWSSTPARCSCALPRPRPPRRGGRTRRSRGSGRRSSSTRLGRGARGPRQRPLLGGTHRGGARRVARSCCAPCPTMSAS